MKKLAKKPPPSLLPTLLPPTPMNLGHPAEAPAHPSLVQTPPPPPTVTTMWVMMTLTTLRHSVGVGEASGTWEGAGEE